MHQEHATSCGKPLLSFLTIHAIAGHQDANILVLCPSSASTVIITIIIHRDVQGSVQQGTTMLDKDLFSWLQSRMQALQDGLRLPLACTTLHARWVYLL